MNEALVSQVEELGLSQKEARVYVASLMLGPSTVQKIADFAGIKRVTTYVILEALLNLGLASQSNKGKKTYFTAEEPSNLRRLLDKKAKVLEEQVNSLEEILPQLQGLKTLPSDSPSVKFYDSAEGIRSIMSSFLESHKDEKEKVMYGASNLDQLHTFFPEIQSEPANPERLRAGFSSKYLYTSSKGAIFRGQDEGNMRESRFVPLDKYPLNGDMSIVGNHIVMLSLSGSRPIGITIDSEQLANGLRALFDLAWETAEKYN